MNKVTGWAVICTITRPNGTWFDKTITDLPKYVSDPVDEYLNALEKDNSIHYQMEEPLILTKEMEVK
jgi:hypothetical protein